MRAMRALNNVLDQAIINTAKTGAGHNLDAEDFGGSANTGLVVSTANVSNIPTTAGRVLNSFNRGQAERFWLMGPRTLETLQQYVAGRETGFGDTVGDNGNIARRFGFQLVLSNNLPYSATLTIAEDVTADDTVTIDGVVFKFVSSIGTDPGNVLIGADAAASRTNLKNAIEGGSGAGTTYIEVSSANRKKLNYGGFTATISSNDINLAGFGDVAVSDTLTHADNKWSAERQDQLLGVKGSTHLIVQKAPSFEFRKPPLKLGRNVLPWILYGNKVFEEFKQGLVTVRTDTSAWV